MKERFENRAVLVEALQAQKIVQGNQGLAEELADAGELVECLKGKHLLEQGATDRDVYFLLAGKVRIIINGVRLHTRQAGVTVGEMSTLNASIPRSATLEAEETCVALKVAPDPFFDAVDKHWKTWRLLAVDLAGRIEQRNQYVNPTNRRPRVFIICSAEALEVAEEIRLGLKHEDVVAEIWSDDQIFPAGTYPIEALEEEVAHADFGIAIASPDDLVRARHRDQRAPRDNVIFELGFFMSRLGRSRTILLVPNGKDLKLPSDFKGITPFSYDVAEDDKKLSTALGPTVTQIKKTIRFMGVRASLPEAK